jgi:hypothetical protein
MNQIVGAVALMLVVLGGMTLRAQEAGKGDARAEAKGERMGLRGERRLGEGGMIGAGMDQGAMIMRMLTLPKILAEADISTEQADKLQAALKEVENKMIDLDAEIKKASLSQAEQMSKLLADTQSSPKELMATVEQIGGLRTDQAKLQIQRLVVIRENLTPDQIAKARAAARAHFEKMRGDAERRGFEGAEAGREKPRVREGMRDGNKGAARPARPEGWGE